MTLTPPGAAGPPMIGALLRMPVDAVHDRMLTALHRAGFTDLNSSHLPVLRYPGPENRRPSDLAREARVTKQAMNYLLGELGRLGYLIRREDPEDRRSKRVHLTARGRDVVRTIRSTVGEIEEEWRHELGQERFARLREILIDLNGTRIVRELRPSAGEPVPPVCDARRGAR